MNKKLIFSIFFCTSILAQQVSVPNLCEAVFIKSYTGYFVKTESRLLKASPVESILGLSKIDDLSIKMQKLEREYGLLSREYNDIIAAIDKEFTELGKLGGLDFEMVESLMKGPKQQAYIDAIEKVNAITMVAYKSLSKQGMQVALKQRAVTGTQKVSTYIEVINLPSKKYFNSLVAINKYKKRFGTKTVTFDFAQNMQNGSAGFSQSATKRIDLGFRGMRNMILDDLITMVGKHEFKHASFAAKRIKGRQSIYHAQYMSTGEAPISSVKNHYNRYMSAEELYNFTNNPFWASNRIGDITKYRPQDYLSDIDGIFYYIKSTNKIAAQTKEVTARTTEYLKKILLEPERLSQEMVFLTADRALARNVDEAFFVHFTMPDGVIYMDWVGAPEFKKSLKSVLDNRVKLDQKYREVFDAATAEEQVEILAKYSAEEFAVNAKLNKEIANMFIAKQETLNKVATNIIPLNEEAVRSTEKFIDYLNMRSGIDPTYYKSAEIKEEFLKLRLMYRKLGNHVKEDFKGFVGR